MRDQIDRFMDYLKTQRLIARNTELAYRSDLQQYQVYLRDHGITQWDVPAELVREYQRELEQRYSKTTTRARKLAAMKAIYRFLLENGEVKENPARGLELPTPAKRAPETLSSEQLAKLIAVADAQPSDPLSALEQAKRTRDRAMLSLLISTGLLASELVALDLDEQTATNGNVRLGKKTFRERSVHLEAQTQEALEHYLLEARPQLGKDRTELALFLNHHGHRLTRQGFWLIVKQYARKAGIEGITPRLLRHSCAARKLTDGARLKEVQSLLGHAHLSTTQVYARTQTS